MIQIVLLTSFFIVSGNCQYLTSQVHKTPQAQEKINNLSCYKCDTMVEGESCVDLPINYTTATNMTKKCEQSEIMCMIKRFSYTTSNENSTSMPKMWSLERKCSVKCESGCIIIGERTKLYACTSCCETSYCNIGRGSAKSILFNNDIIINKCNIFYFYLLTYLLNYISSIKSNYDLLLLLNMKMIFKL